MDIKITKVKAGDLKVGDLYSTEDEKYWENALKGYAGQVGEAVYARTEAPCPKDQIDHDVYKIEINKKAVSVDDKEMVKMLQDCVDESRANNTVLSGWEQEFVDSVNEQYGEKGFLTDKQKSIVEKIWDKI